MFQLSDSDSAIYNCRKKTDPGNLRYGKMLGKMYLGKLGKTEDTKSDIWIKTAHADSGGLCSM